MKKILVFAIGLALLIPTIYIAALGISSGNTDGKAVAFGMWMFMGLPPMVGAFFAFRLASKLE